VTVRYRVCGCEGYEGIFAGPTVPRVGEQLALDADKGLTATVVRVTHELYCFKDKEQARDKLLALGYREDELCLENFEDQAFAEVVVEVVDSAAMQDLEAPNS